MSSDIGHQNQEHIAGEPASGQAKPIPPLNANHTTSQTAVKTPNKTRRKVPSQRPYKRHTEAKLSTIPHSTNSASPVASVSITRF